MALHFVLLHTVVEQLLVHLHKQLQGVVDKPVDGFVPVRLRVFVQSWEYYGHDSNDVVLYQVHYVFIVEKIQRPFCNLKQPPTSYLLQIEQTKGTHESAQKQIGVTWK